MLAKNLLQVSVILSFFVSFLCCCTNGESSKDVPKDGEKITYYEGSKQIKIYIPYKNYLWHGLYKEFYSSGKLKMETLYAKGKKFGYHKTYFENGNLQLESYYKDNKKDSLVRRFFESGQLEWEGFYKNNKLEGNDKTFYINGNLHTHSFYSEGNKHGEQKAYYPSGKPKYIAFYNHGEAGLGLKEYDEKGKLIQYNYKLLVTEENKLAFDNLYLIKVQIQPERSNSKVYIGEMVGGKFLSGNVKKMLRNNGVYIENIYIPKGRSFMGSFDVVAFIETSFGNQLLLTKKINIAENNL